MSLFRTWQHSWKVIFLRFLIASTDASPRGPWFRTVLGRKVEKKEEKAQHQFGLERMTNVLHPCYLPRTGTISTRMCPEVSRIGFGTLDKVSKQRCLDDITTPHNFQARQGVHWTYDVISLNFKSQVNSLSICGPQVDALIYYRRLECPILFN